MNQSGMMMDAPPRKAGWLKWVFIGCGGLLLIGAAVVALGAYYFYRNPPVTRDPERVQAIARQILQFEHPAGYKANLASSMFGSKMVFIEAPDNDGPQFRGIVLMAMPAFMNTAQAQKQIVDSMGRQSQNQARNLEVRPSESFMVRNESVSAEVAVSRGAGASAPLLQYSFVLKNSSGNLAFMTIFGSEDEITHDWVQAVLNTVK